MNIANHQQEVLPEKGRRNVVAVLNDTFETRYIVSVWAAAVRLTVSTDVQGRSTASTIERRTGTSRRLNGLFRDESGVQFTDQSGEPYRWCSTFLPSSFSTMSTSLPLCRFRVS